jgi:hypothetical protein
MVRLSLASAEPGPHLARPNGMRRLLGVSRLVTACLVLVAVAACRAPAGGSGLPSPSAGSSGSPAPATLAIPGIATAGPTCPVQRYPPDPSCEPRPVAGALMVVNDQTGGEVTRATTGPDGTFTVSLAAGSYVLVPQPVEGLMRTAQPIAFLVEDGKAEPPLEVAYDTGIR